jgi:phage terminase small subunit
MTQEKRLTEMQMKFAYELVTNEGRKTKTECCIDAGYSKDAANVMASKLTNPKVFPLVVKYIGELREEYQKKYEVTFENHISELAKLRDESRRKGAWSASINAEVARGKAAGLYVEQKIIRTGKLEDLSAEELESRLKQIINEYSPILEGVEVDELKEKVKKQSNQSNLKLPKQVTPVLYEYDQSSSESDTQSSSSPLKESSSSSSEA